MRGVFVDGVTFHELVQRQIMVFLVSLNFIGFIRALKKPNGKFERVGGVLLDCRGKGMDNAKISFESPQS